MNLEGRGLSMDEAERRGSEVSVSVTIRLPTPRRPGLTTVHLHTQDVEVPYTPCCVESTYQTFGGPS